jgi:hypothetical protein
MMTRRNHYLENSSEKIGKSVKFSILIVASTYFVYSVYFAIYGLEFGIGLIHDSYVYGLISKGPWWWAILYYGSEGLFGQIAGVVRAFAGFFAVYSAFLYWRKEDLTLIQIKNKINTALLLEAAYFLLLIPSIIAAFAYNLTTEYLFYFDHTPPALLLYVTALPCLTIVLVVPPLLMKLRAIIKQNAPTAEITKWGFLACIGYILTVFWFSYSMAWAGSMVPYTRAGLQYGISFLLEPLNISNFVITVVGLFIIAVAVLALTLSSMRKNTTTNLTHIGAIVTALGAYFLFNILYYYLSGGYAAHPSVWYEIIGPLHNPDLWCVTFLLLGFTMIVTGKLKRSNKMQKTPAHRRKL